MNDFFGLEEDKVHDECGVFGVYDVDGNDVARMTYYALYALQHRGQESVGIAVTDKKTVIFQKDNGLITDVFNDVMLDHLKGQMAVGHVRYSADRNALRENAQPLVYKYLKGNLTVAFNGNISNADELKTDLESGGAIFQTTSDAEIIAYLIARQRIKCSSIEDSVKAVMPMLKGAYALLVMSPTKLIACRDKYGFKPLSIGKVGNSYLFASETCAFDAVNAEFIRDVEAGEMVMFGERGLTEFKDYCGHKTSMCIFEHIYFARPDSVIDGQSVYEARKQAGKFLAIEHPVNADVVIGVPDSGLIAAGGYAEQSGIPLETGLIKNRYIGRTFIQPTQQEREELVKIKLNALKNNIEGKKVIMIDDSIVRGTTCGRIVKLLRDSGAKEVHMRVSAPPFLYPCFYGTDVPSSDELIATGRTVEEIRDIIGVDSLGYLSLESTAKIAQDSKCGFCMACFNGKYPDKE